MSQGFPSMTALLGLLAVAGFQNRDKIAEMLSGSGAAGGAPAGGAQGRSLPPGGQGTGGFGGSQSAGGRAGGSPWGDAGNLGGLFGGVGGAGAGGLLGGALNELADRFRQNGQGEVADSWIGSGANRDIAPQDLERAVGPDALDHIARQTGLPREEILARLSRELPGAVDRYTPEGRLPSRDGSSY